MLVGRERPQTCPAAVDPVDLDGRAFFHPEGGKRDFIFVGLCIARIARHLVHRRGEQPPAFRREIEFVTDGLGEGKSVEPDARRCVEGDDGSALGLEADAAELRRDCATSSAQDPAALTRIGRMTKLSPVSVVTVQQPLGPLDFACTLAGVELTAIRS